MTESNLYNYAEDFDLYHYGVLGMKWGIRRYQNDDGTLTSAGQRRYGRKAQRATKQFYKADKFERKAEKANEKKVQILF